MDKQDEDNEVWPSWGSGWDNGGWGGSPEIDAILSGKGQGKAKGKGTGVCYSYEMPGHFARECPMPPKGKGKAKGKFGTKGGKPMGWKTQGTNAPFYGLYNYNPGPKGSGFQGYCLCCGGLGHTDAECPSNK